MTRWRCSPAWPTDGNKFVDSQGLGGYDLTEVTKALLSVERGPKPRSST